MNSLLDDPSCSNVEETIRRVIYDQPDINEDEADVLVISTYAGAEVVTKRVEGCFSVRTNATGKNADPRVFSEAKLFNCCVVLQRPLRQAQLSVKKIIHLPWSSCDVCSVDNRVVLSSRKELLG